MENCIRLVAAQGKRQLVVRDDPRRFAVQVEGRGIRGDVHGDGDVRPDAERHARVRRRHVRAFVPRVRRGLAVEKRHRAVDVVTAASGVGAAAREHDRPAEVAAHSERHAETRCSVWLDPRLERHLP